MIKIQYQTPKFRNTPEPEMLIVINFQLVTKAYRFPLIHHSQSLQSHLESKEEDLNHLISLLRQLKQETSNQDSPYGKTDDRGDGGDGRFAHLSERLKELMKKYRGLHSHLLKKSALFFHLYKNRFYFILIRR